MAKNFVLETAAAFSFPIDRTDSVQTIVAKKDWVTLASGPEFVIINKGTQLHTIQKENSTIKENIYRIGETPLSKRGRDTVFYENSVEHKPPSAYYNTLKKLLETAEKEGREVC